MLRLFTTQTVTVITAATGHRNLARCIDSVQRQTYEQVEHLIVIDGTARYPRVLPFLAAATDFPKRVNAITLPAPTGLDGWCGHRIYGAMPLICNTEFVCFLDEDNWFEPDHIATLVAAMRTSQASWGFALRRIVDQEGNFAALDNCQSLGPLHHPFHNPRIFLVDTSCYFLRREVAVACAPIWHRPIAVPDQELGPDWLVCMHLMQHFPRVACNIKHSVNYTAGGSANSPSVQMFIDGNREMAQRYPQGLPWEKAD